MPASPVLQPASLPVPPVTTSAPGCSQPQEAQEHAVTTHDLNFVMDICARIEAESTVFRRMALRDLKKRRNHGGNLSRPFDIEADLENSLHLVECLPQGSRGAHPPREEFLRLSRAVSGTCASPGRILENALLLEEHALQLLSEKDSRFESQQSRRTVSPWLILSDVEQRQPAESQVALSRRDKWLARRICRLLGGGAPRRQDGEQNHKGRRKLGKRRDGGRSRKRRRKEVVRVASDGVMQEKEGGCEYYSSENYSNTSDEDGEKGQVDVALSNSRE